MNFIANNNRSMFSVCCLPLVFIASHYAEATDVYWTDPVDGNWHVPSNWSNGSVPGRFAQTELGLSEEYVVTMSSSQLVHSIFVTNELATLDLMSGVELDLLFYFENYGRVRIHPFGGGDPAQLTLLRSTTIFGDGHLVLGSPEAVLVIDDDKTLTQEAGHTISGTGRIEGDIESHGLLHANLGGVLELYQSEFEQGTSGSVSASGAGSILQLNRTSVVGGTVQTSDFGMIRVEHYGGLYQAEISGEFRINTNGSGGIGNSSLIDVKLIHTSTDGAGLLIANDVQLIGNGEFIIDHSNILSSLRFGESFELPETYQIRGRGRLTGNGFDNFSQIIADRPGESLSVSMQISNRGLISAENGATLEIQSTIENEDGKIFATGNGSKILFQNQGVSVNNGVIQTTEGAIVENNGNLYLDNTLLLCSMLGTAGSSINLSGLIYHDQQITIDNAILKLRDQSVLYGPGVVLMRGSDSEFVGESSSFTNFTNGYGHRIEGAGTIGNLHTTFINGGTVSANSIDYALRLIRDSENYGLIESIEGGTLELNSRIVQAANGVILANGLGSVVQLHGSPDHSRPYIIQGGEIQAINSGLFELHDDSRLNDVVMNADIQYKTSSTLGVDGTCTINGTINMASPGNTDSTLQVHEPYRLHGAGSIQLGTLDLSSRIMDDYTDSLITIESDFWIEGEGYLIGDFVCDGTLVPGMGIGNLFCTQDLTMTSQSKLAIEVDSVSADVLISETIHLEGHLEVEFVDGFAPIKPWSRVVIQAESVEAHHVLLSFPEPPGDLVSRYFVNDNSFTIGQSYLADMNLDATLDFFDIKTFLDVFSAEDFRADLNNDNSIDFFDVALFIQSYQDSH